MGGVQVIEYILKKQILNQNRMSRLPGGLFAHWRGKQLFSYVCAVMQVCVFARTAES